MRLEELSSTIAVTNREEGPQISQIRRALAEIERPSDPVTSGRSDDLEDTLARLEALQLEEQQLAAEQARLHTQRDAEIKRQSNAIRTEASAAWPRFSALAANGGESGRLALEAFIEEYSDRNVNVGGQQHPVPPGSAPKPPSRGAVEVVGLRPTTDSYFSELYEAGSARHKGFLNRILAAEPKLVVKVADRWETAMGRLRDDNPSR